MREFYNTNADFRRYVDRYAHKYNEGRSISVHEALQHELVIQAATQYRKEEAIVE